MGVEWSLIALVISAAAPTSNSHLHTDRWPPSRRCAWGCSRCRSPWETAAAPTEQPLAHRQVAAPASDHHGSHTKGIRLGDVLLSAHLEQPLAHRQVAILAGDPHGSVAALVRLGSVRARAPPEQPLAHQQVAVLGGDVHGSGTVSVRLSDIRTCATLSSHLHIDRPS